MTQKALKLALEALEAHVDIGIKSDKAITAIKEALAQTEQEPVAWVDPITLHHLKIGLEGVHLVYETEMVNSLPLYDKPQRTWVGLTAGEILDTLISVDEKTVRLPAMLGQFACAIEAKLKEKNT